MNTKLVKRVADLQSQIQNLACELQDLMNEEFNQSFNELVEKDYAGTLTEKEQEMMGSCYGDFRDFLSDLR